MEQFRDKGGDTVDYAIFVESACWQADRVIEKDGREAIDLACRQARPDGEIYHVSRGQPDLNDRGQPDLNERGDRTGTIGGRFFISFTAAASKMSGAISRCSPPPHWRGGAGQAHRRWKMCDGWPAGPAPSSFYNTPAGTEPDPYSPLHSLGARLTLRLHDDACGAVRERARATNPLHRTGIDPKPLRDLAHAWPPRGRQGLRRPRRLPSLLARASPADPV